MVVGPETSPPPPSDDSPSLVTLFSGNGWGDALNQQVVPSANSAAEAENTITFDMLENANLVSRVSSVRLVCGGRATQVMLLDFPNTGPLDHWWPSPAVKSFVLECDPFQTVTANLQQAAPELAGRVGSAHILAHARNKKPVVLFSTTAANIWAGTPLPDGASAPTGPLMQMTSSTSFRVTQDLVLTDFWCGDHDARMVLRVLMNQNKTFLVEVLPTETRVSSGTGDTWGCLSGMQDHLDKGADAAAKKLAALLPRSFLLAGDHPRYYFIPSIAMRVFDLGSGG
jgi:hypothetical protein